MKSIIKENRLRIDRDLRDIDQRRYFSPALYGSYRDVVLAIMEYAKGKVIDIGCGDMPYKKFIVKNAQQYDTLDIERRVPDVKFVSDIHKMDAITDQSYDCSVCLEVIEHVKDPFQALREIHRVTKRGGYLILSAPHLSRLHEEPHDYYRFTKYGLRVSLEQAGFEVLFMIPQGGLFCFLGHQFSTVFLCLVWHIPFLRQTIFFINKWLCVKFCYFLDTIFDKEKIFALGYTVVAKRL